MLVFSNNGGPPHAPPMDEQHDIFFSYRSWRYSGDCHVQPLIQAMRADGMRVWIDAGGLRHGDSIDSGVRRALSASRLVVPYFTEDYADSLACQWELTQALLAGQAEGDVCRRLVPLLAADGDRAINQVHPRELRNADSIRVTERQRVVAALRTRLAAVDGPLGLRHQVPAEPRPVRWLPLSTRVHDAGFVGRTAELWHINSALRADGELVLADTTRGIGQLRARGSTGKTSLARTYAERFADTHQGGVIWLSGRASQDADWELALANQLRAVARALGVPEGAVPPGLPPPALWARLGINDGRWLVVVDDLARSCDAHQLRRWRAPPAIGSTLWVSRHVPVPHSSPPLLLDELPVAAALSLLTARRPVDRSEQSDAEGIVRLVGGHPLLLRVIAECLQAEASRRPYRDARRRLEEDARATLLDAGALLDDVGHPSESVDGRSLLARLRDALKEAKK